MKKSDFVIVGILVVMLIAWTQLYPRFFAPEPVATPVVAASTETSTTPATTAVAAPAAPVVPVIQTPDAPEQILPLGNDLITLQISSYGGVILGATLNDYPAMNVEDSPALVIDFNEAPALRYEGLPVQAGTLMAIESGVVYTAVLQDGNLFKRTYRLGDDYLLTVEDAFVNSGSSIWKLPALRLSTGLMENPEGTSSMRGISTLGIDTYSSLEGVQHWGKKLNKLFKGQPSNVALRSDDLMVPPQSVEWIAAKNKFFVQILTPVGGASGFDMTVVRDGEGKKAVASQVAASLQFGEQLVSAGETVSRTTSAYVGPKDFSFLKSQGQEKAEVLEFKSVGFWKFMNPIMFPIKKALLWGLVHFAVFGNYGIAILLLTIIVRVIFWPLTHKGTESMKRMQALQPKMAEIKEKYKDNPQRAQQETMLLYKENKVNPMGGCLPMLIQIPVFIALYSVLRSAIQLRFSKFLWISDLSEPENLFHGMIPLIGSLNLLPLLMSATMMWQQKLTTPATAATPEAQQQQKMMTTMMPIMMLFFFYSMPSGLVLYWTTSQVLMIAQMLIKKKKEVVA